MMKASDLLVSCLEIEGVEYVFGLPGEELEALLFSLRDSDIQFIPVRHEQGAAFMADVHGRLTGEAGVCLSTLGPGATNLLTGVADAHLDKSPLVAITGQGGLERLHQESHQALDIVHMFEPVVKWNTQITEAEIIPESVRKAFKLAEYEKPGATHLEFPEDVAAQELDAEPLPIRPRVRRAAPDERSLACAIELLEDADTPLVLAGNGAVRTSTANRLRELVDHAGMPVVATYMGKGAVSDRLDNSLMTLGSGPQSEASTAISGPTVYSRSATTSLSTTLARGTPTSIRPSSTSITNLQKCTDTTIQTWKSSRTSRPSSESYGCISIRRLGRSGVRTCASGSSRTCNEPPSQTTRFR